MSDEAKFSRFNCVQDESGVGWHLVCPDCGKVDPATIDNITISVLSWRDTDTVCIDCDPQAHKEIEYWPNWGEEEMELLLMFSRLTEKGKEAVREKLQQLAASQGRQACAIP